MNITNLIIHFGNNNKNRSHFLHDNINSLNRRHERMYVCYAAYNWITEVLFPCSRLCIAVLTRQNSREPVMVWKDETVRLLLCLCLYELIFAHKKSLADFFPFTLELSMYYYRFCTRFAFSFVIQISFFSESYNSH